MALQRRGASDRALEKRGSLFRVTDYDGGLPSHQRPEPRGRLLVTAQKWELRFDGSATFVHGGLARLPLSVTPTGPNSCHVDIIDALDPSIRAAFELPGTTAEELGDALGATANGTLGIPAPERGVLYRLGDYTGELPGRPSAAPLGHLVLTPKNAVELWLDGVPDHWSGELTHYRLTVTSAGPNSCDVEFGGLKDPTHRCRFALPGTAAETLKGELESRPHATWTQVAEDAARAQAMVALSQKLPERIEAAVRSMLLPEETVHIKLKGAFKEALICTDRRVLIVKAGFMTGQTLGNNAYQLPYSNIAGAQVKYHLLSGYFELNAGGMQQQTKRYWSSGGDDPAKAPNCISINTKAQAEWFRRAVAFILTKIHEANATGTTGVSSTAQASTATDSHDDIFGALKKLSELRDAGVLTEDEFGSKKAELLGRL